MPVVPLEPRTLSRPLISLVTDRSVTASPLLDLIATAAQAGVGLIQIRERDLADQALAALVRAAVSAVRHTQARILVNDRLDIALAAGAAGVHLRAGSLPPPRVRALVPPGFVVGQSVHGVEEAVAAERDGGVDYVTYGTVFPTSSKGVDHRYGGLDGLRAVCRAVALPVLAVGGITEARARDIAAAGAAGVAAITLFAGASNLSKAVASLRHAFDT